MTPTNGHHIEHPFIARLRNAGLITDPPPHTPTPYTGPAVPAGDDRGRRYADAALRGEVDRILNAPPGTRNDTLNRASYSLGQLVGAGHIDADRVQHALTEAALKAGLNITEIRRTTPRGITDGATKAPRHVHLVNGDTTKPAHTLDPTTTAPTDPQNDETNWVQQNLPTLNWHALWEDDSEEEWIIEPLLAVGRLVALFSAPKAGKSLLTLELAAAIASGRAVLDTPAQPPRHVLYVDYENTPKGDILPRLRALGYGPADLDNLHYLSFPSIGALNSETGSQQLMAAVRHYQAQVVIIDTVSRAVDGEENSNDTWREFYNRTGIKLKRHNIACLRLDHSGKDEDKGQRGGSAKDGDVDMVWQLKRLDDTQLQLRCTHHRMPVDTETITLIRELVPHLRHVVDGAGFANARDKKIADVVAALDQLNVPEDAGHRPCRDALRTTGLTVRQDVLRDAIKRRKETVNYWDQSTVC